MIGMDGDKMDVRLTRISLRHKAGQEADDPVVFLRSKARWPEMDKEYPRQQFYLWSAIKPVIENLNDRVIVPLFLVPNIHVSSRHIARLPGPCANFRFIPGGACG